MNPEIKAKWVAALRSEAFRQCRSDLKRNNRYCCLGVLCELHRREKGGEWEPTPKGGLGYLGAVTVLPSTVVEWAGLEDGNPRFGDMNGCATRANDELRLPFPEIADLIEANL